MVYKEQTMAEQRENVTKQFQLAQERKLMAIQQVDSKIKQLESVEAYLVEQLSRTQRTQ